MARKIAYWVSTFIVAAMMGFASFSYLTGHPDAVSGFAQMGYPQHLRIMLGIAKLAGAIMLIVPGLRLLKEWAYAGFTFAWIIAFVAHYLAGHGMQSFMPLGLLLLLIVSYLTRPPSRRLTAVSPASA